MPVPIAIADPTPLTDNVVVPEVAAAQDRLCALPYPLVPDSLRLSVLQAAAAAAVAREVRDAVSGALSEAQQALGAGNMSDAYAAGAKLVAAERLVPLLPSVGIDEAAVAEAIALAVAHVSAAEREVPAVPRPHYSLEMDGWRSLPDNYRDSIPPPAAMVADLAAEKGAVALVESRRRATSTVAAFRANASPGADPLNVISAATGTADLLRQHAAEVAKVGALIDEANAVRLAAGVVWQAPSGISSPEIAALAAR